MVTLRDGSMRAAAIGALALSFTANACGGDDARANRGEANDAGRGGAGDETFGCKIACDELNVFACIDADEHVTCLSACGLADVVDRDTFETCVLATSGECSPCSACYETLRDRAPGPSTPFSGRACLTPRWQMGPGPPARPSSSCRARA